MEFCEYCQIGDYKDFCTCSKTGEYCCFVRRCTHDICWKPLKSMEYCKIRKESVVVPDGKNKVRFEKNGKLFVELEDSVITVDNPFDEVPQFVEIVAKNNEYYIKGYEPTNKTTKSDKKKESE